MSTFPSKFLQALTEGYQEYKKHGAQSNKKLKPIHRCIAQHIQTVLGDDYAVKSYGVGDGKEHTAMGRYYPKMVDIAVLHKQKTICTVSFKFVTSNYKQNNINYFENMLGETANLRRAGYGVVQIIVIRNKTPYYKKDGGVEKIEILTESNLSKYINLYKDIDSPHKPDLFHMVVVDVDEEKHKVKYCKRDKLAASEALKDILFGELSIACFAEKFPHLCQLKK